MLKYLELAMNSVYLYIWKLKKYEHNGFIFAKKLLRVTTQINLKLQHNNDYYRGGLYKQNI